MQNFMTRATYSRLAKMLSDIKDVEIPRISREKLEAARHGDLSENAEYHAAKEKLELLHSRYSQIESRISNPVFIDDITVPGTIVSIGTVVRYKDLDTGKTETFTILGAEDSDVEKNIISFQSPIAKGLIGKKPGDECLLCLPGKDRRVAVEEISVYKPL
jgi:transcription elongation factor GreA